MKVIKIFFIAAIIAGVALALVALPLMASAWYLNQANPQIARALSLPIDSPYRIDALVQAEAHLNQARNWSDQPRITLALTRIWLARDEPARAVETVRPADASLRHDAIAELIFGEVEMRAAKPDTAYERWRAGGAYTFFINAAHRARVAHRWGDAEEMAYLAVGIAPESADAHYALGDSLSRKPGFIRDAMGELELAAGLTRDPELRATILSRQGEIFAAQGDFSTAFALFDQAMQVAPRDARPRTDYARLLLQTQPSARDRAEEILKQSIAIAPWDTLAFATLAEIAQARGDVKSAEEWYAQGFTRNPNNPALLFHSAQFYMRQNRLNDARQSLILALRYETRGDELQKIARELESLK